LTLEAAITSTAPKPDLDIATMSAQMAKGNEEAYRKFFNLYFGRLLRYLFVLTGNEETAREALQLTLLRVAKHAKRFESEEVFWSWLTRLARSSVIDESRKASRYLSFLTRFFEEQPTDAIPDEDALGARMEEVLQSSLTQLELEEQELLRRKYSEGESVKEIAAELLSTEKAIESRLTRARQRLKNLIIAQLKNENET
jgi:RNA polymerase sigma factor (sigma-70 family)